MASSRKQSLDFDQEARDLWAKLNLDPESRGSGVWNPVDPIFRHPTGKGTIYVGNQTAAENYNYLRNLGITHVVNCTHGFSKIPNFHEGKLQYYNFPISHWTAFTNTTNASIIAFSTPLFQFIDSAIAQGHSVLVHCLAGAHRAGTTGCACLMHYADMDVKTAILTAKRCRPIIDPIGQLPEFLHRLKRAYDAQESKGGGVAASTSLRDSASSPSSSQPPSGKVVTTQPGGASRMSPDSLKRTGSGVRTSSKESPTATSKKVAPSRGSFGGLGRFSFGSLGGSPKEDVKNSAEGSAEPDRGSSVSQSGYDRSSIGSEKSEGDNSPTNRRSFSSAAMSIFRKTPR
jgi:protein-tyrosine phosphatase